MGRTKRTRFEETAYYFKHLDNPDRYPLTEALKKKVEMWLQIAMVYISNNGNRARTFTVIKMKYDILQTTFNHNLNCALEVFGRHNPIQKEFWQAFAVEKLMHALDMAMTANDYKGVVRAIAELRKVTDFTTKDLDDEPLEDFSQVNLFLDDASKLKLQPGEAEKTFKRLNDFLKDYSEKHGVEINYELIKG